MIFITHDSSNDDNNNKNNNVNDMLTYAIYENTI